MKKQIAKLWIKALRSGKYKQGQTVLRNEKDEYCCLGVLCDLYNQDCRSRKKRGLSVRKGAEPDSNLDDDLHSFSFNGETAKLPWRVQEWAGMWSNDGLMDEPQGVLTKGERWYGETTPSTECTLAGLNDRIWGKRRSSFKQIATIIEKNVELL